MVVHGHASWLFWAQVVAVLWMIMYMLHPSPLPTVGGEAVPGTWFCILVACAVAFAYLCEPWFAGFFAIFSLVAMHVTRHELTRGGSVAVVVSRSAPTSPDVDDDIAQTKYTQQVKDTLEDAPSGDASLEVAMVQQFAPLGKSFLYGGGVDIKRLPVGLLP